MTRSIHPQSEWQQPATLTVAELIEQLSTFDPALPVIYRLPIIYRSAFYGFFGSSSTYTIDGAERVTLPREQEHHPAAVHFDEETGEEVEVEAYTDVRVAWDGVVLG